MVAKFTFWLEGLIEDDPLPCEIDIIVFNTRQNGKYKYIECIGYEQEINSNSLAYYPLEAQCFLCGELAGLDNKNFCFECEYIIEEAFSSKILKQQFKNINIFFKYEDNIKLLFKV